jgi:protein ImuA
MVSEELSGTLSIDRHEALTELERRYPDLWRAGQLGQNASVPVWPTGYEALSAELPGGGWPVGALTELLQSEEGVGELRLLRPALQSLAAASRRLVFIGPPHQPNAMGLAAWGLPAKQTFWLRTTVAVQKAARRAPARQDDTLWATEQVLRSHAFGGVLVWLPTAKPEVMRRLQVLAQASEAVVWVARPATALRESSPAVLRLHLSPQPDNALSIVFHKRRGPARDAPLVLVLEPMPAVPGDVRGSPIERQERPRSAPLVSPPPVPLSPSLFPASSKASCEGSTAEVSNTSSPFAHGVPASLSVPVVEKVSSHVVLDRGSSTAPVPGRAAAELA